MKRYVYAYSQTKEFRKVLHTYRVIYIRQVPKNAIYKKNSCVSFCRATCVPSFRISVLFIQKHWFRITSADHNQILLVTHLWSYLLPMLYPLIDYSILQQLYTSMSNNRLYLLAIFSVRTFICTLLNHLWQVGFRLGLWLRQQSFSY